MIIIKSITVFTPTYNRKENLKKCYTSLLKQTNQDFIWQIVDDGSTDDTESLVNKWKTEKKIEIEYIKKENGGKASSINLSLSKTVTPLWLTLDSDDYLFSNAIHLVLKKYSRIKNNNQICGMIALRSNPDGTPMQNQQIPSDIEYATQNYIRYILGIPPEYMHVFKTDIIKQYPYPIIKDENYIPLSYVFDQIDQKYKYLILHAPLMVCEYQKGGITKSKRNLIKKNPKGYTLYKKQLMKLSPNFITKIKASANFTTGCLLGGSRNGWLKDSPNKILTILTSPIGLADYIIRYILKFSYNPELSY